LLLSRSVGAVIAAAVIFSTALSGALLWAQEGGAIAAMPSREPRFLPLPGKAIGVLVAPVEKVLKAEGRTGPADAVAFSRDGGSYRWMYLPALERGQGERVSVELPDGTTRPFPNSVFASREELARRGLRGRYVLVEALVNGGMGSAPSESFVATELRTFDGPGGTPVLDKFADQVAERCRSDAASWSQLQDALNALTRSAAEKSLAAKQSLFLYVTWWSLPRKVGIDCRMDLTRRETRRGIGIVPNLERAAPQEMQEYGTELKAEKVLAYSISEAGALEMTNRGDIKTFEFRIPPPPMSAPSR
jgi:hypothetical protein